MQLREGWRRIWEILFRVVNSNMFIAVVVAAATGAVGSLTAHMLDEKTSKAEKAESESSYKARIAELKGRITQLEVSLGQLPDVLLEQAQKALAQGDRSEADKLFEQIEAQTATAIRTAAKAAYQRSRIALDDIRYLIAYDHARRAVRLVPENDRYLTGASELARKLDGYTAAKGYYKQVLTSDIQTYGKDDPKVAIRLDHLGNTCQKLEEYKQAIAYYKQALVIFESKLGLDHFYTKRTRARLTAARAGQDVTDAAGRKQSLKAMGSCFLSVIRPPADSGHPNDESG